MIEPSVLQESIATLVDRLSDLSSRLETHPLCPSCAVDLERYLEEIAEQVESYTRDLGTSDCDETVSAQT